MALFTQPLLADTNVDATSASDTNDYTGVYRNANGSSAHLFKPETSDQWVMNVSESTGGGYTLVMKGTPQELTPVGLSVPLEYRGKPMTLVAEGGRMYARGESNGHDVEFYTDAENQRSEFTVDRASSTSAESVETRLLAQRHQASWDRIRSSSVEVNASELLIHSAKQNRPSKQSATTGGFQRFGREKALEDDEQKKLAASLTGWQENLAGRDEFLESFEESATDQ